MASSPSPDPRPAVVLHGGPTALPTLLGNGTNGTPRLATGGKIRAGIKVLTRRAAEVPRAQTIYEQGLNQGQSFDQIERALAEACPELKSPLVPRNVPWFTVRAQDFPNPELATQILDNSEYGVRMTKVGMWANLDAPSLRHAMELENRTQVLGTFTGNMSEAGLAFREKRAPHFSGR